MSPDLERHVVAGEQAAERFALALPRNVPLGTTGARLGRRSGHSLEFQEHREYQPGDDLRHLDWSAYARSDRLIVKLYREEVTPHLDLLIDGSRSMALEGTVKAEASAGLAALLAQAALRADLTQNTWLVSGGFERLGSGRPSAWKGLAFEHRGSLGEVLDRSPRFRPRGVRMLLSDLLFEDDPRHVLAHLAQDAAAVVVVQLLALSDMEPIPLGYGRLVDSETGESRDLLLDRSAVDRFRIAFESHQDAWQRACREIGAVLVTLVAERLVDGWTAESLEELVRWEVLEVR